MDDACGYARSARRDCSSLSSKCCCDKAVPYHSLLLNICYSTGSVFFSNSTILDLGLTIVKKHRNRICVHRDNI